MGATKVLGCVIVLELPKCFIADRKGTEGACLIWLNPHHGHLGCMFWFGGVWACCPVVWSPSRSESSSITLQAPGGPGVSGLSKGPAGLRQRH